jgi:RNA polymerase sigma-70 factor (ECF subfamily)
MELQVSAPASIPAEMDDERSLVERAKRDPKAFALIYRSHYRPIAGYIYRRVGDVHVTEDLVADVFTAAMQALPRYRHRGLPVRAWLFRIASNSVNRWARRQRRSVMAPLNGEESAREASPAAGPSRLDDARAALLMLPPKYQTALALHYLEAMPIAEVALATGCRVGTIKSRLARGREALRRRLEQRRFQS